MSMHNFNIFHRNCRTKLSYPKTKDIFRFHVPHDKINWNIEYINYKPIEFTHQFINGQTWADVEITPENREKFLWNNLDNLIDRRSHNGKYDIDSNTGRPKNPFGRTGLTGRGSLGRWGPNHAADPIVTRWMMNGKNKIIHEISKKPILEFVAIKRRIGGSWALPGGMVELGEDAFNTAQREFSEEALNSENWNSELKQSMNNIVKQIFQNAKPIYQGYIDDERNTDNSWMETVAFHIHDEDGENVKKLKFQAGDDATDVKWMQAGNDLELFANHKDLIKLVVDQIGAHWNHLEEET